MEAIELGDKKLLDNEILYCQNCRLSEIAVRFKKYGSCPRCSGRAIIIKSENGGAKELADILLKEITGLKEIIGLKREATCKNTMTKAAKS